MCVCVYIYSKFIKYIGIGKQMEWFGTII